VNGFNSLTDQLQEERKELRSDLAALRLELATEKAETARLRLLVHSLGGHP
jgi:ribosomal protein L29